jgi:hypothetical protein
VSCSSKGVVELEYLVVLLSRFLDLAEGILDRPPDLFGFLLGVLILTTGLGEFLPEVASLFLEEYNTWPLLIVGVLVHSPPSIVVLGQHYSLGVRYSP